jgi:hypothetical protein
MKCKKLPASTLDIKKLSREDLFVHLVSESSPNIYFLINNAILSEKFDFINFFLTYDKIQIFIQDNVRWRIPMNPEVEFELTHFTNHKGKEMIDYLNNHGNCEYFKWCIGEIPTLIRQCRYILAVLQKVNEIITFDEDELHSSQKTS